jgi:hypothetical protein
MPKIGQWTDGRFHHTNSLIEAANIRNLANRMQHECHSCPVNKGQITNLAVLEAEDGGLRRI